MEEPLKKIEMIESMKNKILWKTRVSDEAIADEIVRRWLKGIAG